MPKERARSHAHGPTGVQTAAAGRPVWIISAWWDLALFIGTPVVILPALLAAQGQFGPRQISLFIASFGALGHHVPGLMRAYGDRLLFQRFNRRFVLAPLIIGGACTVSAIWDLPGIVLVTYLWGVWHGLMQTYGFLRIYDAKAGSVSRLTSRLDQAMCVAWFGIGVLRSPSRMFKIFSDYYASGAAAPLPASTDALVTVWTAATAIVTFVFIVHSLDSLRRGQAPSPIKLLLMASSFAFWWYSNVTVTNMLVGIALFEVFHDVQYLSIVWMFNLNRVDRTPDVGGFTTFLFRRSAALVGMYVGLVVAYGSLNFLPMGISSQTVSRALHGLLTASALLHFYYDGFIWKVRERDTRESLGVTPRDAAPVERLERPTWVHALRWTPAVGVAIWLALSAGRTTRSDLEKGLLIAAAAPASAEAQNNVGISLIMSRRVEEGIARLQQALRLDPNHADAHSNLGLALAQRGDFESAVAHYEAALRFDPSQTQTYSNLGNLFVKQGKITDAIRLYQKALGINPDDLQARTNLAGALLQQGNLEEAIAHLQQVLRTHPTFTPARQNLDLALARQSGR